MILLNQNSPYKFDRFDIVNNKLSKTYMLLENLKKPIIKKIISDIDKKKIEIVWSDVYKDPRVVQLNKDRNKVQVNISELTTNLDRAVEKGNLPIGEVYDYLLQAYGLLNYEDLLNDREWIKEACIVYCELMVNLFKGQGVSYFRTQMERDKLTCLLMCFILTRQKCAIRDIPAFASRESRYSNGAELYDKYKTYFDDSKSEFDAFFHNVLGSEFPLFLEQESEATVYLGLRLFGATGAMVITDLAYLIPICLDFSQTNNPIIYKKYGGLKDLISKQLRQLTYTKILNK